MTASRDARTFQLEEQSRACDQVSKELDAEQTALSAAGEKLADKE